MIEARIDSTPVNLPSGQQIQIQDYPQAAIREAIANALMHGDHRERRPVYIEHSPELLTVRSPGPLVSGISPANILTHPPKARFPALAEAMRACGLAEKWGQGVDRMYREMIRSGRAAPTVEVIEGKEPETAVRFMGGPPNARIAKFISTLPASEQEDTDTLLVVATLANRRTINAEQLSSIVQRDAEAAQAVLSRLAQGSAELVEPTPRSLGRRHPDYRLRAAAIAALGPALSYQSRPKADSDRKIYAHIRQYGSINNAAVQRMFDVDVYAARDLLRDLMGREVLIRTSERARGPGVKYGAGPKFPGQKPEVRPVPPPTDIPLIGLDELDFGPND
jgi:ATP-dependent DNA helicase RecG